MGDFRCVIAAVAADDDDDYDNKKTIFIKWRPTFHFFFLNTVALSGLKQEIG